MFDVSDKPRGHGIVRRVVPVQQGDEGVHVI